jgi:hypothetical protein
MFQVANCSSKIFESSPMNFIVVESNKGALDQHSVNTHADITTFTIELMLLISGLLGCKHNQQAVIHQVWTSYDGNVVKIPHL